METATNATDYRVFVRTGRHFRSEIAPLLSDQSIRNRRPMPIEVALLDFRNAELCGRYADYRSAASFDREHWSAEYVQAEVLATILRLWDLKIDNSLLEIDLFLARRLSTFRIEGSSDAIIVTREDPKDLAARYHRNDSRYDALRQEFDWIKSESELKKLAPIKGTDYSKILMH